MRCYLSTPGSVAQAQALAGRDVLISYAYASKWLTNFTPAFGRVMWDSGAYTVFAQNKKSGTSKAVDLDAYAETARSVPWSDSVASLDDIAGDWRQGLANWDRFPWMFPVYHDSDPPEALDAILERMQDQDRARIRPASPQWLGLGMTPPRPDAPGRRWLAETLPRIPVGVHVHGFAMRGFADLLIESRGSDCSADSVNWFMAANQLMPVLPWLTAPERVAIIAKKYERDHKTVKRTRNQSSQIGLFEP